MSTETMNTIITAVVVPILVALVPFIVGYLNKLSEEIKTRIKDKNLAKYIDIAEDAIETSVIAIMQTYVDSIKGTDQWTKEAQEIAFGKAKIQAITIMGAAARCALKEVYGDLDTWINAKIQEYVKLNKKTVST